MHPNWRQSPLQSLTLYLPSRWNGCSICSLLRREMKIWSRNDVACRLLRKEWEWEIRWWNIPDPFIVGFLLRLKFFTFYRESENLITWKMGSNFESSCQRGSLCYVRISGELEDLGSRDNVGGNICPTNWFEFLIKLSNMCRPTLRIVISKE